MWLKEPTDEQLRTFLEEQSRQPFTYAEVGALSDAAPAGFVLDHNRVQLGHGPDVFAAGCEALRAWQQFSTPWTRLFPTSTPIEPGRTVVMLARAFGMWWPNACRIVCVIDEPALRPRFGFVYGTLPGHAECGEERFLIESDEQGHIWYDLRSFSRPRHPLARLAKPLARRLQRRFVRDSQSAMRRSVGAR